MDGGSTLSGSLTTTLGRWIRDGPKSNARQIIVGNNTNQRRKTPMVATSTVPHERKRMGKQGISITSGPRTNLPQQITIIRRRPNLYLQNNGPLSVATTRDLAFHQFFGLRGLQTTLPLVFARGRGSGRLGPLYVRGPGSGFHVLVVQQIQIQLAGLVQGVQFIDRCGR